MRFSRILIILLSLITTSLAFSQISHGGTPYFLQPSVLRAGSDHFFIEMPAFNRDSVLREDAINEGNGHGSYRFAHKFYTRIDCKDAVKTILPDGTTVSQIGIRSSGAYSINLLLSDFEIPPGGKLFVYNADHSYVVGSFDYRNNSPDKRLPIQPVAGESVILEYSEPADAPFNGRFVITEVNHDYRNIFRKEPGNDSSSFSCMPDVYCSDATEETIRSTVLLIINGNIGCTGTLINNTSNDGKPYLLTAVHCLVTDDSKPFPVNKDSYINISGTIIAFFNYNRPVCNATIPMKGSEEMSLAGAVPLTILARKDIALLELKETPPDYFNAYYAGWNRDMSGTGRHTNVHHPSLAVKKYGMKDGNISTGSIPNYSTFFDDNSHWIIPGWTLGSTWNGSSGSPLFDENQLVVGGLTGGNTDCSGKPPVEGYTDYFFALGLGWETNDPTNQLKTYLDPRNIGIMQYPGLDPYQMNPVIRKANAQYTNGDLLITDTLDLPNRGYVFGNSNLQTLEFAEEFSVSNPVEIYGAYLLLPTLSFNPSNSAVMISLYTGESSPQQKIDSARFLPQFLNYSSSSGFFSSNKTLNTVPTESLVVFDKPVPLSSKKFFISYSIQYSANAPFCVYNTKFNDASHPNTAWLKDADKGWIPADAYMPKPMKTSLAIQPLLRNKNNDPIDILKIPDETGFYYDRSGRVLTLRRAINTPGQISVYSIGGQLLEKIQIQPGQTAVNLHEQPKGTIGIVKIANNYSFHTGKIMY